ncbi:MAG: tRNA 2-thiouridine(34) synthase MnmA [Armatimonadetes bacterium]|nr:tRNA 2-thiouridine(34) synthase MnmA [Armatimonadota bacterium]
MSGSPPSVVVGMSGGVDSAVAAALLIRRGYAAVGVTMRLLAEGAGDESVRGCCSLAAVQDARETCAHLGMPHYVVDLSHDFTRLVVEPFVAGYAGGVTPNPCTVCNAALRFEALARFADTLGVEHIATGHYARTRPSATAARTELLTAVCAAKDQSYMLYGLSQEHLRRAVFPLGDVASKEVTRSLAADAGLHVAHRSDSQDVCFVGPEGVAGFLAQRAGELFRPGEIVDEQGHVIGAHDGVGGFTVGQRRRLPASARGPLFVTRIGATNATVHVGPVGRLYTRGLVARSMNWVSIERPSDQLAVQARIRYNAQAAACVIRAGPDEVECRFDAPQRAVTPGQAVVFYDGDRVLGGGVIDREPDSEEDHP